MFRGLSGHRFADSFPDIRGLWIYCWLSDSTNSGTAIAKLTTSCLIWSEAITSACLKSLLLNLYRSIKVQLFHWSLLLNTRNVGFINLKMSVLKSEARCGTTLEFLKNARWTAFSIVVWLKYNRPRKWVTLLKGSFTCPRDPFIISIIPEQKHFQWNSAIKKLWSHVNSFLYLAKQKNSTPTF